MTWIGGMNREKNAARGYVPGLNNVGPPTVMIKEPVEF